MGNIMHERRNFLKLLGIFSGGAVLGLKYQSPIALAKEFYPSKRISWITDTKPGAGADLIARITSPFLVKYFKESAKDANWGGVVIRNETAAGGKKAYSHIYRAKPDGYTIGDFNTGFYSENIFASDKIDIDCTKFTFLVRAGVSLRLVIAHKNGFKTWDEMMKSGKEKELKWAAGNFGRGNHIACILLKESAKVPARLINFPGSVENSNALMRGDVDMAITTNDTAKGMLDSGEFRVLTVFSETSPYPGVRSVAQLGYPDLAEPNRLHRLMIAPPNLSKEITDILLMAFKKTFNDKEFRAQAQKVDFNLDPLYGADAERLVRKVFKYYDEKAPLLKNYLT